MKRTTKRTTMKRMKMTTKKIFEEEDLSLQQEEEEEEQKIAEEQMNRCYCFSQERRRAGREAREWKHQEWTIRQEAGRKRRRRRERRAVEVEARAEWKRSDRMDQGRKDEPIRQESRER
jgi:hypothetical protein